MEYRQLEDNYELIIKTGSAKQILRLSEGRAYRQIMICPNDGKPTASSKPLSPNLSPSANIFTIFAENIFL